MNATKIIALICKSNIENTLTAHKNIVKVRKFKKADDLQNNLRREQENIKIQRFLNQKRRLDDDSTT